MKSSWFALRKLSVLQYMGSWAVVFQWDFQAHLSLLHPIEEFLAWWDFQALFKECVMIVPQEVGLAIVIRKEL